MELGPNTIGMFEAVLTMASYLFPLQNSCLKTHLNPDKMKH